MSDERAANSLAAPRITRVAVPLCTTPAHPGAPTVLYVAGDDWLIIGWNPEHEQWNEHVAPGRYIVRVELVDEGTARLHTILRHRPRLPVPVHDYWHNEDDTDAGLICTAIYIPTSVLPRAILERMHT